MLDKKIVDLLNYRIQQEELSSRIYEQISLMLDVKGFLNTSALYKKYAAEEMKHASWAKEFLTSYNIEPELMRLDPPNLGISTISEALDLTLKHEEDITKQVEELTNKAMEMKSYTCMELGLKYCREQVEEINKANNLVDMYSLTQDDLVFDHHIEKLL